MAVKYRIEYEGYSLYPKKNTLARILLHLLPWLACASIIALLFYLPEEAKLRDLLLPGDPAVTTDAFVQLSESLDQGESLSAALDVFCHAILDVR